MPRICELSDVRILTSDSAMMKSLVFLKLFMLISSFLIATELECSIGLLLGLELIFLKSIIYAIGLTHFLYLIVSDANELEFSTGFTQSSYEYCCTALVGRSIDMPGLTLIVQINFE